MSSNQAIDKPTGDELQDYNERFFDPFWVPRSDRLKAVIADVLNQLQSYERHFGLRRRARKQVDQNIFEETVTAIVCDLVYRYLEDPKGTICLPLSHRKLGRHSRYRSPALGKTLPHVLRCVCAPEMDFVALIARGGQREVWGEDMTMHKVGRQTVIGAAAKLLRRIHSASCHFDDLARSPSEEIIILKDRKPHRASEAKILDYDDTPDTHRYREDLSSINAWLAEAELVIDSMSDTPDNTHLRKLKRVFNNGSFRQGGRLFGGFWMDLKKAQRRSDLVIEGESIAELDYGQMALRLLYGKTGATPPEGDLYDIPGVNSRGGAKLITNAALYADTPQTRMPQGARDHFARGVSYQQVINSFTEYHAPIADQLFKGIGMELMFLESQIMVDILMRLKDQACVALPIHDGLMCARSSTSKVKSVMHDVFYERTGIEPIIRIEA